tara:strand:+ start:412 stop:672 length:261 start_codon:yes stop_codon:yes gene_type:complete
MTNPRQIKNLHEEFQIKLDQHEQIPCREMPELFFPEDFSDKSIRDETIRLAKRLCDSCPVKIDCLSYAIQAEEVWGVWGGTTPAER